MTSRSLARQAEPGREGYILTEHMRESQGNTGNGHIKEEQKAEREKPGGEPPDPEN